jgi:RNA polymerase sigma-70 factor, ECF subfamily
VVKSWSRHDATRAALAHHHTVAALAHGGPDPERLPELLDRLYRSAWALCGSPHEAEDLVQETMARVLARPRLLRRDSELPYLMRALRNTYLTGLRTAGRRPRAVELPPEESANLRSSLAEPEAALEQRAIFDAIAGLSEEFRAALVAVDVLGLTYREAARALRTREATIASRLFRARQRLARSLGEPHGSGLPVSPAEPVEESREVTKAERSHQRRGWRARTGI